MAFTTVGDVVTQVRVFLQDTAGDRFTDAELAQNVNSGIIEMRRLRPDLFRSVLLTTLPQYTTAQFASTLAVDQMYIPALVFYVTGLAQLRDAEESTDARAVALLGAFNSKLLTPTA